MGYESKLYIVEKGHVIDEEKRYAQLIAMFDLCKFYPLSGVLRDFPKTDCYFYGDDGNKKILEDNYSKPLTEAPIEKVIAILEKEISNGNNYRRILPVFSALTVIKEQKDYGIWKDVVVLHYGY